MEIAKESFNKSSEWIKRNARPLEAARWGYLFEDAPSHNVIHYLSAFQNEDGGFGHGIEPDFWTPDSSPMATWTAGQVLMEIGAGSDEKIVQSMLSYLTKTCNESTCMWPSVLPENNQHPHAPWWHWKEGVQDNWMFNPSAELAGFLVHWSTDNSEKAQLGWTVIQKAIDHLMNSHEMDSHEINNYQQLLKMITVHADKNLQRDVSDKINTLIEKCVDRDVSAWSTGYKPLPLDFIDGPDHPLCEKLGDLVEQNLDFYIEQLSEEGTWGIPWEWGSYPEAFAVARRNWIGILLIDRYKIFKTFGLLDDIEKL
ncbi:hypothetical protein SAMN04487943_103207 [Gracilibacillus orientalis]|uniref:Prenyltransferase and squalene oxidase repeat-containing protein n=1 Tax=Gracilibacillus orientalis TaxID=334253 RepID=A0A1I4JVY0_9BACI|nr:hypothetical protein [Gracilibacillus orientalis]SFL70729.1 hypothetical protein SAMN04487943_103207 [Gracilibacillus orientalis]